MALTLAHQRYGDGPPLVVLHGLFGSGRNWAGIAKALAAERSVVTVDLRNHGGSPWAEGMDYGTLAADVRHTLSELGIAGAAVLGHSMGGKAAMRLALDQGDAVAHLIVVDIAPVAYAHDYDGYIDAMRALDLSALTRRSEADGALAEAIPDPGVRAFLLQNLANDNGGLAWRINLDAIDRAMPDILAAPAAGGSYDGPCDFVAGANSDYLLPEHEGAIRPLFPRARRHTVEGAGHWVHAEQPARFVELVRGLLA